MVSWDSTATYNHKLSTTGYKAEDKTSDPIPIEPGSIMSVTNLPTGAKSEGH